MPIQQGPLAVRRIATLAARTPWMLAALMLAVTSVRISLPAVGTFRDDGIYLSSARALASGKGYVIDILPGEPPNTKYPPLTSLLVAPLFAAGLDPVRHAPAFKIVPFAFLVLWLAGLRRLGLEMGLSTEAAGWVIACTTASAWVAYCGTMILSDVPAAALITWGLVPAAASIRSGHRQTVRTAAAAVLLGLAFLTRTQSAAVTVGIALYLLTRRRWKQLVILCGVSLVLAAPWIWWVNSAPVPEEPVLQYYSAQNYRDWWAWNAGGIGKCMKVVLLNLIMFLATPSSTVGFSELISGIIAFVLILLVALHGCKNPDVRLLLCVILVSVAVALFWQWPPPRLLLSVFPLLWIVAASVSTGGIRRTLAAFAMLFSLQGLWLGSNQVRYALADGNPPIMKGRSDDWARLRQIAAWLQARTLPDEIIGALHDGALPLLAERKAVFPVKTQASALFYERDGPQIGTPEELAANLKRLGIRFVVLTPSPNFTEAGPFGDLLEKLQASPDGCMRLAAEWDGGYRIYEFACLDRASP